MQAEHAFDVHRRTPWSLRLGINRLDDGHQIRPRYDTIHFVEKSLAAGGFSILLEGDFHKGLLVHGRLPFSAALPVAHSEKRINQTFPSSKEIIPLP